MPKYPHKKRKTLGKQRQHLYMTIGLKGVPYYRYGLVQGIPYFTNKTVYIILHCTAYCNGYIPVLLNRLCEHVHIGYYSNDPPVTISVR